MQMLAMQQTMVLQRLTVVHDQHARAAAATAAAAGAATFSAGFGVLSDGDFRLVF